MGAKSSIEWTRGDDGSPGAPWNPVAGRFAKQKFTDIVLHPDCLDLPLHWRKPRRIFVNSMSDLFHERVPETFIRRVWQTMAMVPRHSFQVLTKRAERMAVLVPKLNDWISGDPPGSNHIVPLRNVWLGVSAKDQKTADERILLLLTTPAAVRFVNLEPPLGPVDLDTWPKRCWLHTVRSDGAAERAGLDWVIVGGESGGPPERSLVEYTPCIGARDCSHGASARTPAGRGWHPKADAIDWVREIRDQCQAAGVPFFFKQWGGSIPKSGGRLLDGRTWEEYPP